MISNIQQHHKTASHGEGSSCPSYKTQMLENSEKDIILLFFYCKMHHISKKWTSFSLTK